MRALISILLTMFFVIPAGAQLKQEVIASAGGNSINGDISLSWTIGETIIPTFTKGDLVLSHGFHQPLIVTSVKETLKDYVDIQVFPNPTSDIVNLLFASPVEGETTVNIIDYQGKLIKVDIIESTIVEKQINMQYFPAGIYYLCLTKGKLVNVYKVVKL